MDSLVALGEIHGSNRRSEYAFALKMKFAFVSYGSQDVKGFEIHFFDPFPFFRGSAYEREAFSPGRYSAKATQANIRNDTQGSRVLRLAR